MCINQTRFGNIWHNSQLISSKILSSAWVDTVNRVIYVCVFARLFRDMYDDLKSAQQPAHDCESMGVQLLWFLLLYFEKKIISIYCFVCNCLAS